MNNLDKAKKVLRITGLFKLVFGSTLLLYNSVLADSLIYSVVLLLIGLFFFYQSYRDDETIYNNRIVYLILSVIGIYDLIGSIILFICFKDFNDNVNYANAPPKKKYSVDKDAKKVDILLKLGIFMVFISGLIFATTSWDIIPNIFKVVVLTIFGILFLALSIFTEQSLKLYKSAFLYWMLSMAFFVFTIIGLLYFEIISTEISLYSNGSLAYGIIFLSITGFLFVSHFKYSDKNLLTTSLYTLCVSIFFIINNFSTDLVATICIFLFISLLLNVFNRGKNETIEKFATVLSYALVGITIGISNASYSFDNEFLIIVAVLIDLLNIGIVTRRLDSSIGNYLGLYLSYTCIFILFIPNYELYTNYPILLMLIMSLYTLAININLIQEDKIIKYINSGLYSFLTVFLLRFSYGNISSIIISLIFTVFVFIYSRVINNRVDIKLYKYLETFTIMILISSIMSITKIEHPFLTSLAIISVIYCIIYTIYNRLNVGKDMNILYGISLLLVNIMSIIGMYAYPILWVVILIVFTSLYLFVMNYSEDKGIKNTINSCGSFILFLESVFVPFVSNNIFEFNEYLVTIAYIVFLLLIVVVFKNKKITNCIVLYMILPLMYLLINNTIFEPDVEFVLGSIIGFYSLFAILFLFIKNSTLRNIFAIIGCVLLLFNMSSGDSTLICIYMGIIGLVYVIIGYINDKLYPLFVTGIIVILIDLINGLWELWAVLPFWLYLLVIGLSIIAFVMNREIQKQKKKSS